MLRKAFYLILLTALFAGLVATPVNAAPPVSYQSGFQIRNLTSGDADVVIYFYNTDGTVAATVNDVVPGNATNTYFPLNSTNLKGEELPSGFKGSVVIASNAAVSSMSNLVGYDAANTAISYASYSASSEGGTNLSLPLLMKANYGYNTFFAVQNTGTGPADVNITYSDGGTASATDVMPGASVTFDQGTETHSKTVFSATVGSDQPVAATVVEVGPTTLFAYSGFTGGSQFPVMPLVNENNFGYFTGIQVQNLGGADTQVTIAYSPSLFGTACTEVRNVAAGTSVTFAQNVFTASTDAATFVSSDCVRGQQFVGSGKVTVNTGSQPLVAVVNQLNNTGAAKGAAYMAFNPDSGKRQIVYPLIMDRNYGYFTSWSIVDVANRTVEAGTITCTVTGKDKAGTAVSKTFNNPEIAPGGSWTLNHQNQIADGFVGGATCLSSDASDKLVGSANQLGVLGSIDSLLVYEGFAVDPQ